MGSLKGYIKKYAQHILKRTNHIYDTIFINLIYHNVNSSKKKYVFIDLSLIGDVLVSLPYYKKLFENMSDNDAWIISLPTTAKLFNTTTPNVIPIDLFQFKYNPYYRTKCLFKIGKCKFCAITHPNRIPDMEYVCLKLNSMHKIAYEGEYIYEIQRKNPPLDSFSYVINNPYSNEKDIHISKHFKALFEGLSGRLIYKHLNFSISKKDYLAIFKRFNKVIHNNLNKKYCYDEDYVVILTDASAPFRKYPRDKWQIILNNLPNDIKIIQIGLNKFPLKHINLIDLTGKTSLEEAMSIVMNASLVIGNETGLTHLGYLSGVPTVCILGGGHFGRFLPWKEFDDIVKCVYNKMDCFQCGWRCKYVNLKNGEVPPCIKDIKPEKVIDAINELNKVCRVI